MSEEQDLATRARELLAAENAGALSTYSMREVLYPESIAIRAIEKALRTPEAADLIVSLNARIEELVEGLKWALPLAERALEEHRRTRFMMGCSDIGGTDAKGNRISGLWQSEIDQRARARSLIQDGS